MKTTVKDLNLSADNTAVVAEKRSGKPKYGCGCQLKSVMYYQYRHERNQSGCHLRDGWEDATDSEVSDAILALHGFTRDGAILSARGYTESVYGENYGRINRINTLIVPAATDTVETLCAKYIAREVK
jgi:hypothetical protein